MTDEERIDVTPLVEPDEPGSDLLLDDDVREAIAARMREDGLEPRIPDPADAPAPIQEAIREARKRRDEARAEYEAHPEADPTAIDPDEPTG
jgi:hypothetical protein